MQYEDYRSIGESNVEDLAAVAQPLPEDVEGAGPRVSDDEIAQKANIERISPQQAVEMSSHKITETLNVLVNANAIV